MAPIRRYLRITLHSVLEVRIYLDEPALADSWLLRSRDPVLPRIIAAIRPYVIPKLREENEKAKGKGSKKKKRGIKDTVATGQLCSRTTKSCVRTSNADARPDEFEVSIFLTETSTPHTLLSKQKTFTDKRPLGSNSTRLGVGTAGAASERTDPSNDADRPIMVEEHSDPEVRLDDIPVQIDSDDDELDPVQAEGGKRKRDTAPDDGPNPQPIEATDEKKKLAVKTRYDGFTIYGRVLCLIVKRKGVRQATGFHGAASGSDMMENWVSTQAQPDELPGLV